MTIDRDAANEMLQEALNYRRPEIPTQREERRLPETSINIDDQLALASLREELRNLQSRVNEFANTERPQPVVYVPESMPQFTVVNETQRRSGGLVKLGLGVVAVAGLLAVGARLVGGEDYVDVSLDSTSDNSGTSSQLPPRRSRDPIYSYSLTNQGQISEVQTFGTDVFKHTVELRIEDMFGGSNSDGSINPEALGFDPTTTLFSLELRATDQKEIQQCGIVNGATYLVKARNQYGPVDPDVINSVISELEGPEKIRMFSGVFDVASQEELSAALNSSLILLIDEQNQELAVVNGCTEVSNG